jgi:tRNA (guanosine-2'-O-)-methyltransferase
VSSGSTTASSSATTATDAFSEKEVGSDADGGGGGTAGFLAPEWDRFEFGSRPKRDERFVGGGGGPNRRSAAAGTDSAPSVVVGAAPPNRDIREILDAAGPERLEEVACLEAEEDGRAAARMEELASVWERLDPDLVQRATAALLPLVRPERVDRIRSVLDRRTRNVRFLYENPSNPSNVWACLRTIDSFGIQHVDVVVQSQQYRGKAALTQKRGMRTALGSARWLTVRNHPSARDAVESIRDGQGFRIVAADVNPSARDIRTFDWARAAAEGGDGEAGGDGRPVCIVMGNEERGISDEMRSLADDTFYLPMAGFAESFNLGAATAVTLAYLSAASSSPIRPGDLPGREYDCLVLKGILNSVANKRVIRAYLQREGIVLPDEIRFL